MKIEDITFGKIEYSNHMPFQEILYNGKEVGVIYPKGNWNNFLKPMGEVFQFGIEEQDLLPFVDKVNSCYSDVDTWHFVQANSIEEFIKFYNVIYGG